MKRWTLIVLLMFFAALSFADEPNKANVQSSYEPAKEINVPWALMRGTVNLCTFWFEIPRELVVEYNHNNIYGIANGLVKGTYYACSRFVYTFFDFLFLGFTGPNAYDADLPEFFWEAQWNPWPKEAATQPDQKT